jgi:RNA polymerase sigma-70 factor (ECF subfamily)
MGDKWMDGIISRNNDRVIRLEKWMDEYGTAVLRMCILCFFDAQLAERAMQRTFLKAYHQMDRLERKGTVDEKVYLMHIALHTLRRCRCISRFRHIGRHRVIELPNLSLAGLAEHKKVLFQAIMDMPFRYKEVVLLFHYQGMTVENVGKTLHLSKPTVQYRLKTASEKIRSKLERWYFDE